MLLCLWPGLQAQVQIDSRLAYRRYTIQDGLPQMQTERVWQDSHGYIYIGTLSGFVRYDGRTFTPFLKGRRENIVGFVEGKGSGEVRALGFRRQWVTGFDEAEMRPIDPQGNWLLNNFNAGSLPDGYVLLEDAQEENRQLCMVSEDGFVPVLKGDLLDKMTPDRKLFVDSNEIYIPTGQGLYRVKGCRAERLTSKEDMFALQKYDKELLAFAGDGIYTIGRNGVCLKTAFAFKAPDYGLTVRPLADGELAIADSHTLYVYDGRSLHEAASGFNLIKDVFVDRWGRLWLATYEGLFCFFKRSFTNHQLTDEDDIVRAVGIDGGHRLVAGTLNGKLLVDGQIADVQENRFYMPSCVTIDGAVYMPGDGDVMRYDGCVSWLGLPPDRYLFVAKKGDRLILGSRKCIAAYDPGTGTVDTLSTEIPHPWCAAEDAEGHLWVGSSFGLFMDGKKVEYPQKLVVSTMEADAQGNVFFASADSLFLVEKGKVRELSNQLPRLAGHEVRSLHVSAKGWLVIAVIDGLFVCRVSPDYHLSDLRFFDHTNGFTILEPQKSVMAEDDDGTVWLAGVEQMCSFKPADLLDYHEKDTCIEPPMRWWQHLWVWLLGLLLTVMAVWAATRWYEKRRSRRNMIRLEGKNLKHERQLNAIRKKAIEFGSVPLAHDIVKMTEKMETTRVTIHTTNGTKVVDSVDIAYFKAERNYTQMVMFQNSDVIFMGLGAVERQLDPKIFMRADRSTIVNIHNISMLDARQHRCVFRSPDGTEVETTLLTPAFKRLKSVM